MSDFFISVPKFTVVIVVWALAGWIDEEGRECVSGGFVLIWSHCVGRLRGLVGSVSWWVVGVVGGQGLGCCFFFFLSFIYFVIHISVSATGVWLAECPFVVGEALVPFSGGDSPLVVGLSTGSWGRGATDTRVLAWFSSSTW